MNKVNAKIGTDYKLFNYYGAPDAEHVIIAMGSVCDTIEETIDYINAERRQGRPDQGSSVSSVRRKEHLIDAIPASVKTMTVLDRTKEPGSIGEPLYPGCCHGALKALRYGALPIYSGRYGLGSKDTAPADIFAVYRNMETGTTRSASPLVHRRRCDRPVPGRRRRIPDTPRGRHYRLQILGSGLRRYRWREQKLHQDHR